MKIVEIALRWVYGLFYAATGALWFVNRLRGAATPGPSADESEAAKAFSAAIAETGYLEPLIAAVCLAGGALLFARRTAPLGILVLLPLVTGIFLFHLSLNSLPFYRAWGTVHFAWLLVLAWIYRDVFGRLWNRDVAAPSR